MIKRIAAIMALWSSLVLALPASSNEMTLNGKPLANVVVEQSYEISKLRKELMDLEIRLFALEHPQESSTPLMDGAIITVPLGNALYFAKDAEPDQNVQVVRPEAQ